MRPETEAFLIFLGQFKEIVMHLGLCAARIQGALLILPVMRRAELGVVLQAGIALGIGLPVAAVTWPGLEGLAGRNSFPVGVLIIKEVIIGVFIGLLFSLPFWAVQAAGEIIDMQRTIGESGITDPSTQGSTSVTAALLMFIAIATFVADDGLQLVFGTIYSTYDFWPINEVWPDLRAIGLNEILSFLWRMVTLGLSVAGPIIIMLFISDFVVMSLSRVAGRIDISMLLPLVKNTLFCFILLIYAPTLMGVVGTALTDTTGVRTILERLARP